MREREGEGGRETERETLMIVAEISSMHLLLFRVGFFFWLVLNLKHIFFFKFDNITSGFSTTKSNIYVCVCVYQRIDIFAAKLLEHCFLHHILNSSRSTSPFLKLFKKYLIYRSLLAFSNIP